MPIKQKKTCQLQSAKNKMLSIHRCRTQACKRLKFATAKHKQPTHISQMQTCNLLPIHKSKLATSKVTIRVAKMQMQMNATLPAINKCASNKKPANCKVPITSKKLQIHRCRTQACKRLKFAIAKNKLLPIHKCLCCCNLTYVSNCATHPDL